MSPEAQKQEYQWLYVKDQNFIKRNNKQKQNNFYCKSYHGRLQLQLKSVDSRKMYIWATLTCDSFVPSDSKFKAYCICVL